MTNQISGLNIKITNMTRENTNLKNQFVEAQIKAGIIINIKNETGWMS